MKKAIVVLGMHRSGTSSIAGTLAALGVTAPKTLMPQHPRDNPKGYWESLTLVRLNDRLLEAAGSSWKDWRAFPKSWLNSPAGKDKITELAEAIEAEFEGAPLIVLKDPRICRIFPVWKRALNLAGYKPLVIIPVRHPVEVAASLSKRERFAQSEGLLLWLRHVLDAEKETRKDERVFVLWEDFIQDWKSVIGDISRRFELDLLPASPERLAAADALVDPDLRRNTSDGIESDASLDMFLRPFEAMKALVQAPYDADERKHLDKISRNLEAGEQYLGPVVMELRRNLEDDAKAAQGRYAACQASLTEERARSMSGKTTILELKDQLQQARTAEAAAAQALAAQKEAVALLSRRIISHGYAYESLSTRLKEASEEVERLRQESRG